MMCGGDVGVNVCDVRLNVIEKKRQDDRTRKQFFNSRAANEICYVFIQSQGTGNQMEYQIKQQ